MGAKKRCMSVRPDFLPGSILEPIAFEKFDGLEFGSKTFDEFWFGDTVWIELRLFSVIGIESIFLEYVPDPKSYPGEEF
jgi:hypothetical protein